MKVQYQDIGRIDSIDQQTVNQAIVVPAKEALRIVRQTLTGNLTIRDNQYAAIVTLGYQGNSSQTLTSGTEYTLSNPLSTKPIGFTPILATNENGTALSFSAPSLNMSRTDGLLGITVALSDHTEPFLSLAKSTTQSIPTSGTFLTWDTIVTQRPMAASITSGVIYVDQSDASKIKVTAPGSYLYAFNVVLAQNAGGNIRASWATLSGSTRRRAEMQLTPGSGVFGYFGVGSVVFDMTTSDYVQISCYHDAGVSLNAGGGPTDDACYLQVTRTYSLITGIVTGILWGG